MKEKNVTRIADTSKGHVNGVVAKVCVVVESQIGTTPPTDVMGHLVERQDTNAFQLLVLYSV